ncbi:MAG: hypothetical protein MUE72_06195 [Chitinophagaceae bacterium]|nr:hypothetical protein [Chitinophagaceae bacterium]
MKSKGNNNKPVLKVVTTKTLQPSKRYHSADVCLAAVTWPRHNSLAGTLSVQLTLVRHVVRHAADDKSVVVMNSINFYMALLKNKVPAEMVLQQAGGHGFGLNNKAEPINWLNNVFGWMMTNQLIKRNVQ